MSETNVRLKVLRYIGSLIIIVTVAFAVRAALKAMFPPPEPPKPPAGQEMASPFKIARKAVGNRLSPSYVFTGQDGGRFDLGEWYDKPLIVSYIFTSCQDVCPAITSSLSRFARDNEERLGKDFRIVSVGFDVENDTVEALRRYGEGFTDSFESWKFVTGDPETIKALADRLGIIYEPQGMMWRHTVGVTIVAPGGFVHEQVMGPSYSDEQLLRPIERAKEEYAAAARDIEKEEK
ncbi:MAG: SCO family protein [Candidatus Nitrospinota bacterium M3_3B_026]